MKRLLTLRNLAIAAVLGAALGFAVFWIVFWIVTISATVSASALPPHTPNCPQRQDHVQRRRLRVVPCRARQGSEKGRPHRLGGGLALGSPFGMFYAPNISPDPKDGIGAWSEADFITAMWDGTAPDGSHLFPAFPYASYRHMQLADVRDPLAYLKTLPRSPARCATTTWAFPFNIRRLVGGWRFLFLKGGPYVPDPSQSEQWNRGAYLVNGPGHRAECHSPRNFLGGIIDSERFAGGPAPDGKAWVPNITPAGLGHWGDDKVAWSEKEIASFLDEALTQPAISPAAEWPTWFKKHLAAQRHRPRRHRDLHCVLPPSKARRRRRRRTEPRPLHRAR